MENKIIEILKKLKAVLVGDYSNWEVKIDGIEEAAQEISAENCMKVIVLIMLKNGLQTLKNNDY